MLKVEQCFTIAIVNVDLKSRGVQEPRRDGAIGIATPARIMCEGENEAQRRKQFAEEQRRVALAAAMLKEIFQLRGDKPANRGEDRADENRPQRAHIRQEVIIFGAHRRIRQGSAHSFPTAGPSWQVPAVKQSVRRASQAKSVSKES